MAIVDWGSCTVGPEQAATIQCLEPLFQNVVGVVVSLAGIALFVMLLTGGFTYLFSGGDQKKLEQASATMTNAVVGLVVIVSSYLILRILGSFTGLGDLLTTFNLNIP